MVKVRQSQIPVEDGKPVFIKNDKKMKTTKKSSSDYEDEEDDDDFDCKDEDDELPKRLKKVMIHFKEEGVSISAYDIHTIEKDMKFLEKPSARWVYGITINKGLQAGQFVTKTDLSMWYISEEVRDKKYDRMMELLQNEGLSVIEI